LFNHVLYSKHLLATHVPWAKDSGERWQFPQGSQYGIVRRPFPWRILTGDLSANAPGP
jgi:hypothetical protein